MSALCQTCFFFFFLIGNVDGYLSTKVLEGKHKRKYCTVIEKKKSKRSEKRKEGREEKDERFAWNVHIFSKETRLVGAVG